MNKNSLKSLVLGFVAMFTAFSVNAGSGTQASPFKVCGAAGFKLTSSVTAPTGGTYQWLDQTGAAIPSQTSISMTLPAFDPAAVTDTIFKVVVFNAEGCASDTGSIYVTLVPKPTDTAIVDNSAFCSAQATATTLNLNGNVGTNPSLPSGITMTYAWTGGTGTGTITNDNQLHATTVPPTAAGSYTYTLTVNYDGLDAYPTTGGACQVADGVTISVSTTPATPGATIEAL